MKIDILCSSRELFGADRSALRLAEALRTIDVEPTLVLPSHRPERGLYRGAQERGVSVREAPIAIASSKGIEGSLGAIPRRSTADLSIFNTTAVLSCSRRGRSKIVMVREWLEPGSSRHRLLAARHRMGAHAVVGVSSGVMGQWRGCAHGPARQYVVCNWLDRQSLNATAQAPAPEGRSGIVCVGRFNQWKGQDVLAAAYEQAFDDRDGPSMTFVGAQPDTEFAARADAIAERGRAWGWQVVPFTEDPSPYYRAASLVVVPSLKPEPFGTVILEAIAHGCRVVAFEGGGPTDMAERFPGSLTLVQRSVPALADALRAWWSQGGKALSEEQFGDARKELEASFSPEAAATSWAKIVETVAD